MKGVFSLIRQLWLSSKTSLGIIFCFLLALLLVSNGDLTGYSPSYLWKNLVIFSCLVVVLRLNAIYLNKLPLKWKNIEIPSFFTGLMLLHLAYTPLMILVSRLEHFPWYFPLVSLTVCGLPHLIPWQRFVSFVGQFILRKDRSPELKGSTLEALRDKTIVISTTDHELACRYAYWVAKTTPKTVVFHDLAPNPLLQFQLHHDFPSISWIFSDHELNHPCDLVIDGYVEQDFADPEPEVTLKRIDRILQFCEMKPQGILTLIPMRTRDDQGNMIVEDYARRLDREHQRVIPIRHYPLMENAATVREIIEQKSDVIKVQFTDTLVIHSLNLIAQLLSNRTSIGEAWVLTEVVQLNQLTLHKKISSENSFQDKVSKIRQFFHQKKPQILTPGHLVATNEPCLAVVAQPSLSRKKLDSILKKIAERCQDQEEAA